MGSTATPSNTKFVVLPYMSLSYAALDPYGTNLAFSTFSGYQPNNNIYQAIKSPSIISRVSI